MYVFHGAGGSAGFATQLEQAADQAGAMALPASLVGRGLVGDVRAQIRIVLAVHQFSAEFAGSARAFFFSHSSG